MDISYQIVSFFYHLSLIVWLGGIITIAFIAAPALFKTLPSRTQAGEVAAVIHRKFQAVQLASMITLLVSSAVLLRVWENLDTPVVIRYLFIFDMVVLAVFNATVVSKRLRLIRAEVVSFEGISESDPRKQAFSRWHRISVIVHLAILISGLGALFLS